MNKRVPAMDKRDAQFEDFRRMLDDRPRIPEAEVEADIAEAIAVVRTGWRPEQG
ncbi:MAG TPA: hypothetical protein VE871_11965 [Longimicrobium sp.]|nr:hypothetical protein [Longimicrobium sp.]